MQSLNRVTLLGNVGDDPDVRNLNDGSTVANFSVACNERWKDKHTGEEKQKTEWIRVAAFGVLGKLAADYLKKGSRVYLEGQFRTRKWQDKDGQDRYSTEVHLSGLNSLLRFLDQKSDGGKSDRQRDNAPPPEDMNSEIPF